MDSDKRKTKARLISELDVARQQLRERGENSIVEKSNDGIVILQNGLVVFANAKAAEIIGVPQKAISGKPFINFVAPKFRDMVIERYQKRLAGENVPSRYEIDLMNEAGSVISVEVNASLIEHNGKPATLSIVRDITDHKKIEKQLKESEERYRTLFEASAAGIMIADVETKKLLHANSAICRMLGYSREELTNMTVTDIHPIASWQEAIIEFTAQAQGRKHLTTLPLKRKDGTVFPADISAAPAVIDGRNCNVGFFVDATEREQTRKSLESSEAKFRSLAEHSPNMVFINQAGKIVYANQKCQEIMGYRREEFYDESFNFLKLVAPENAQTIRSNFYKHSTGEDVPPVEYTLITKEGNRIESILSTKLIDYKGTKAILGVVTDISEQKRTERELALQAGLLNAVSDAIFVHDLDGNIAYVNDTACRLSGYPRQEMLGMNLRQVSDPETISLFEARIRKLRETGEACFEAKNRTKAGTSIPLEIHAALRTVDDRNLIISIVHDISERKQAQEALAFQAGLLEATRDTIIVHDLEGNILYVNNAACSVFGYTREELLNMNLGQIAGDPETARLIRSRLDEVIQKGLANFEVTNRRKDGTIILREIHDTLLNVGERKMIVAIGHDITERKRMQAQLILQDRLASIGKLVSGIAHELNNPLTSIIGFSELLLEKELPDDIRADLDIVNQEATRTSTIVKNY